PRLLVPAVEALGQFPAFVLVLASGPVIDLDDALCAPWAHRLIVALPDEAASGMMAGRHLSGAQIMHIEPEHADHALLEVLDQVLLHRFRVIAGEPPEELDAWFRDRFSLRRDDRDGVWARISGWLAELDRPDIEGPDDPARRILCAIGWRAKIDAAECVEGLQKWQSESQSELANPMARAAARLLFKMIGIGDWLPSVDSHGR